MAGVRSLRKIQLSQETTAGTIAAATTIWRGKGTLEDAREIEFDEEDVGLLTPTDRSHTNSLLGKLSMDKVTATFQQVIHLFEAGILAVGTGSADGSGSGKIYTYPIPTTAAPTTKTYTIEGGDNQQAEVMEYSFVEKLTLDGESKKAIMMGADWQGRQIAKQAFTGSLSIPTVSGMAFGKTKLYIDGVADTYGSSLISASLLGWGLEYTTGLQPVFTDGGNLYFGFAKMVQPMATLSVTLEHDANSVAEKDAFRAETARLLRLLVTGAALTTAGTSYSVETMVVDLAGKWESFDKIDEIDGNDILKGTFRMGYNATVGNAGKFIVVNELASVP